MLRARMVVRTGIVVGGIIVDVVLAEFLDGALVLIFKK
jgi:hypothetical protein